MKFFWPFLDNRRKEMLLYMDLAIHQALWGWGEGLTMGGDVPRM